MILPPLFLDARMQEPAYISLESKTQQSLFTSIFRLNLVYIDTFFIDILTKQSNMIWTQIHSRNQINKPATWRLPPRHPALS